MQNKVMIASNIVSKINKCQVFILQGVSENAKQLLLNNQIFVLNGCTRILKRE
jgi:hypothetical protein